MNEATFKIGQRWRPNVKTDHVDTITEVNYEKQTIHFRCEIDGEVHIAGMAGARNTWTLIEDVPTIQPTEPEQPKWKIEHTSLLNMATKDAPVHPNSAMAFVAIAAELRKVNN